MALRSRTSPPREVQAEEGLLIEAAQNHPERFADLYELHFAFVYAYIVRRVGDRDTAEDLTSEVFQRALSNLKHFEWRGLPFAGWLARIAANAIADRSKRSAREVVTDEDPDSISAEPTCIDDAEKSARLFMLVEALPDDQRRVINMRFAEEKTLREVAQAMKRSEGAIKQLQFRALQNLRARIDKPPRGRAAQRKNG